MGSTNLEFDLLAKELNFPNYVSCKMLDQLIGKCVGEYKFCIIHLQNSNKAVSNWLMYFKTPLNK